MGRDEIKALCVAHDRFMAEQAAEQASKIGRMSASETDLDGGLGLIFKTVEDAMLPLEPAAPELFGDPERDELFADVMGETIRLLRQEWRADIAALERRLKRDNASKVIDLPSGFWKRKDVA
jgi:hypothetical protein